MQADTTIIFVTDPLCSWCWGMAEAIEQVRQGYAGKVQFDLRVGGINTQAVTPLTEAALPRFTRLWHDVQALTSQPFAFQLPTDGPFVYNSLPTCRAVVAARNVTGEPPFEFLHALQRAFFVEARNTTRWTTILELAESAGLAAEPFRQAYEAPQCVADLTEEMRIYRAHGTQALPSVLIESRGKRALLAGGYVDAPMLSEMIDGALASASA